MTDPNSNKHIPPHPVLPQHYASEGQRVPYLRELFDATAEGYDRINAWMSFNRGDQYRYDMLTRTGLAHGQQVLDVATGTGVLAAHAQALVGDDGLVVALDPSLPMLGVAARRGIVNRVAGTAERLPLPEGSFHLITMGYALRHVDDLLTTFREYHRVLRQGGQVLILEMVPPRSRLGFGLTKLYLKYLVPAVAAALLRAGKGHRLMRYYWDTVAECVPPETVLSALREVGFNDVQRSVQFGILTEYRGTRP